MYANKSSVELIQKAAKVPLSQLEDADFYDKLERARSRQTTNRVTLDVNGIEPNAGHHYRGISLITGLIVFRTNFNHTAFSRNYSIIFK